MMEDYNKEKQKRGNCIDATHVCGFWRHYQHEKFKNKRGKVEWIKPFYRGKDKEIYSKLVKITSHKNK